MGRASKKDQTHYRLEGDGRFVIEDYNSAKPFSNFFPGIAGLWGIPMWVFYVNRGQGIASFGIEAKNKAIMEFQPANKSYRLTSLQGFRTFIKVTRGAKTFYWEPFQNHLTGTDFQKSQTMSITAHDLTIAEVNKDLGLEARVNYFTMPEEPYAALVRRVSVTNTARTACAIEVIDGLPLLMPFGMTDWLMKNMSRTVEAWVQVLNVKKKAPYYQLKVEVADTPQVTHIKEGNFFFSFDPAATKGGLLDPIVEAACVFGASHDFAAPERFLEKGFRLPAAQQTSNRTPCAMNHARYSLKPNQSKEIVSLFGYARNEAAVGTMVKKATQKDFIDQKARRNKEIIDGIRSCARTHSASLEFDLYAEHTFLDNILRGGLPISVETTDGHAAFNVYSRKHGDLERDYNYFVVAPTFYSQGNGNYRDVNQNRRNDVWFNTDVRDSHLTTFFNLSQADGYNPLIVNGASFRAYDLQKVERLLSDCVKEKDRAPVKDLLLKGFQPGVLLRFIDEHGVSLKVSPRQFFKDVLCLCHKQELAEHGEGFWSDHWTYNLDLVERYLALYPEDLKGLLLERKVFRFYHDSHYVLPREERYILTERGVRQYKSVAKEAHASKDAEKGNVLRVQNGEGEIYRTHLAGKILCLIANKIASLDPSGTGVEMEADKPNWYDALNGLPGLLGSSISETFEIKRFSLFLQRALTRLALEDTAEIQLFGELADFIRSLRGLLASEPDSSAYWQKSNDIKEEYRRQIRHGIRGDEKGLTVDEIKTFLKAVIEKTDKAVAGAKNKDGFLATYFYHEVTQHESAPGKAHPPVQHARPLAFARHALPLFLEGYVHALRVEQTPSGAKKLYQQIKNSGLYDKKLKMYKVNADLSKESEEIGRARIFPAGWLENASIWLHMEYKLMLELLRAGLYEEFYENFRNVLIPFLKPQQYGRSILENSSFLVSSAHEDASLHGQGFVARLSGSTAEFLHMWLWMNAGKEPFRLDSRGKLILEFKPILPGWLFTAKPANFEYVPPSGKTAVAVLPARTYAFNFLNATLVVYHNPKRRDTFKTSVEAVHLRYPGSSQPVVIASAAVPSPYAEDVRSRKVERIDVYLK